MIRLRIFKVVVICLICSRLFKQLFFKLSNKNVLFWGRTLFGYGSRNCLYGRRWAPGGTPACFAGAPYTGDIYNNY